MATSDQGVRIGPISLFTLVASIGMAVLAVLTISTANAMSALSQRTATMAREAYQAEGCAQALVASIDEVLAQTRKAGGDRDAALVALSSGLDDMVLAAATRAGELRDGSAMVTATADVDGSDVVATFDTSSGRRLDVRIAIKRDLTFAVTEWKATSQAGSVTTDEHLWMGTSS